MNLPGLQDLGIHCSHYATQIDASQVKIPSHDLRHTGLRSFSSNHRSWLLAWDHILVAIRRHFNIVAVLVVRISVSSAIIARRVCAT